MQLKSPSKSEVRLTKLNILSHQCKIAKKIEIILASDIDQNVPKPSFDSCQNVRRLGYVSIDPNDRTNFQARELKSIDIAFEKVNYIKLIIHQCHQNGFNPYNQVGIIAITMLGKVDGEQGCGVSIMQKGVQFPNKHGKEHKMIHITPPNNEGMHESKCNDSSLFLMKLPKIKTQCDSTIEARIGKLETEKTKLALMEEFENAAKLKDLLTEVHRFFATLRKEEENMRQAALDEDYPKASKIKLLRDDARKLTIESLNKAELLLSELIEDGVLKSEHSEFSSTKSTILRHSIERKIVPSAKPVNHESKEDSCDENTKLPARDDDEISFNDGSNEYESDQKEEDEEIDVEKHPLEGIPGYEELPTPEAIKPNNKDMSQDMIQNIESVIGSYRTRCLFSKNWNLREAAIMKISIITPSIINSFGVQVCSPILCQLLDLAINDRIIQVLLTSLILLDDCLSQFELAEVPQKDVLKLMGRRVIEPIVGKLGDSKKSVVEGCETVLMSMALSKCVGPTYIGHLLTKAMKPQDLKSGKAVSVRFRFLQNLVETFGEEAGRVNHIIHFIRGKKYMYR